MRRQSRPAASEALDEAASEALDALRKVRALLQRVTCPDVLEPLLRECLLFKDAVSAIGLPPLFEMPPEILTGILCACDPVSLGRLEMTSSCIRLPMIQRCFHDAIVLAADRSIGSLAAALLKPQTAVTTHWYASITLGKELGQALVSAQHADDAWQDASDALDDIHVEERFTSHYSSYEDHHLWKTRTRPADSRWHEQTLKFKPSWCEVYDTMRGFSEQSSAPPFCRTRFFSVRALPPNAEMLIVAVLESYRCEDGQPNGSFCEDGQPNGSFSGATFLGRLARVKCQGNVQPLLMSPQRSVALRGLAAMVHPSPAQPPDQPLAKAAVHEIHKLLSSEGKFLPESDCVAFFSALNALMAHVEGTGMLTSINNNDSLVHLVAKCLYSLASEFPSSFVSGLWAAGMDELVARWLCRAVSAYDPNSEDENDLDVILELMQALDFAQNYSNVRFRSKEVAADTVRALSCLLVDVDRFQLDGNTFEMVMGGLARNCNDTHAKRPEERFTSSLVPPNGTMAAILRHIDRAGFMDKKLRYEEDVIDTLQLLKNLNGLLSQSTANEAHAAGAFHMVLQAMSKWLSDLSIDDCSEEMARIYLTGCQILVRLVVYCDADASEIIATSETVGVIASIMRVASEMVGCPEMDGHAEEQEAFKKVFHVAKGLLHLMQASPELRASQIRYVMGTYTRLIRGEHRAEVRHPSGESAVES